MLTAAGGDKANSVIGGAVDPHQNHIWSTIKCAWNLNKGQLNQWAEMFKAAYTISLVSGEITPLCLCYFILIFTAIRLFFYKKTFIYLTLIHNYLKMIYVF